MTSAWLPAIAATGLPGSMLAMPTRPLDDREWDSLYQCIVNERLAGLLLAAVETERLPATDEQRESAIDLHAQTMATVLLLERCLLATTATLQAARIQNRVLKGTAVAHLDYADPALRSFVDVDLLIRSDHFDAAVEALVEAGYRRRYPEPRPSFDRRFSKGASFHTPDGFELDLHRTFVMGPYGLSIDLDQLWESAQPFMLGGQQLYALDAERRLLHACYHTTLGDVPPRLAPRRDIAEMLLFGSHDVEQLLGLARAWRAEAVVAYAIRSAWETLHIADSLRLSSWAMTHQPLPRDKKNIDIYLSSGNNYTSKSLAAIGALPTWRDRASFITALALPKRQYVDSRHHGFAARLRHGLADAVRGRMSG